VSAPGSQPPGGRVDSAQQEDERANLPQVGSVTTTRARTVTEADITMFSALTGDWHPQHSDAEWASESPFGERIAHGLLVLSFALGLGGLEPDRVVALRRLRDVVFKRPTRIGETIRARVTVQDTRPVRPGLALVETRWVIVNAVDEALVRATIEVLWSTAAAAEDGGLAP
jgi:3-hydroxybutyryl-CoA dehydratase